MIDPGLDGTVAVVTGVNNPLGIGGAIARALARQGVAIFGTYLRAPSPADAASARGDGEHAPGEALYRRLAATDAAALVEVIRADGGRVEAVELDLADPTAASRLFASAEAAFGPVSILVNNAAYSEPDSLLPGDLNEGEPSAGGIPIGAFTTERHDRHFHVNVRAPALLMREFARRHRERVADDAGDRCGRIVNVSTAAADAFPTEVSYGASKHALESLTRSAAHEFGPLGITVNVVAPGPIQSGYIPPEAQARIARATPLGRVGAPEDVADVVVFLASAQARWLTGQLLYVGGGHSMSR